GFQRRVDYRRCVLHRDDSAMRLAHRDTEPDSDINPVKDTELHADRDSTHGDPDADKDADAYRDLDSDRAYSNAEENSDEYPDVHDLYADEYAYGHSDSDARWWPARRQAMPRRCDTGQNDQMHLHRSEP